MDRTKINWLIAYDQATRIIESVPRGERAAKIQTALLEITDRLARFPEGDLHAFDARVKKALEELLNNP